MDPAEWQAGHADFVRLGESFLHTLQTGKAIVVQEDGTKNTEFVFPWVVLLELTAVQMLFNILLRLLFVQPGARALMMARTNTPRKVTHARVIKFSQSALEALFYSGYFVAGLRVVMSQEWLWPSTLWYQNQPDNVNVADDIRFFYLAYMARYVQAFLMVLLEPRRKDFVQMQLHHAVTVLLIYVSYSYGFVRVGVVIMVLLDVADPPLHLAKLVTYVKEISPHSSGLFSLETLADLLFAAFAILFTITRMVLFVYVTWSVGYELFEAQMGYPPYTLDTYKWQFNLLKYAEIAGWQTPLCFFLVVVLQGLQAFWFCLLVKVIYKKFATGDLKDNRSDSEASDSELEPKKTK